MCIRDRFDTANGQNTQTFFFGTNNLTFTNTVTLTATPNSGQTQHFFDVMNSAMTLNLTGTVTESIFGSQNVFKDGEGTLEISGSANWTGFTRIGDPQNQGTNNRTGDGGTLLLAGNGTLLDTSSITVNQGGVLKFDDSGTNLSTNVYATNTAPGRVSLAANIGLNNGKIWL